MRPLTMRLVTTRFPTMRSLTMRLVTTRFPTLRSLTIRLQTARFPTTRPANRPLKGLALLLVLATATTTPVIATEGASTDAHPTPAQSSLNPQEILAASDAVRNPDKPFGVAIVLTEYRNAQQVDANTLAIYSKLDPTNGRYRTLVRYVGPPRDTGKLVLQNGTEMWFFDPSSEASIRISPQQRLL